MLSLFCLPPAKLPSTTVRGLMFGLLLTGFRTVWGLLKPAALLGGGFEAGSLLWPRVRHLKVVHSQIQLYLEDLPSGNPIIPFSSPVSEQKVEYSLSIILIWVAEGS